MASSSRNFLAYLAGVATGAAIGILYAPDKGEVTRDRLAFRLSRYRNQLQNLISDLMQEGEAIANTIAEGNSEAKIEGQKVVHEARSKAEKLLDEVDTLMAQIKAKN